MDDPIIITAIIVGLLLVGGIVTFVARRGGRTDDASDGGSADGGTTTLEPPATGVTRGAPPAPEVSTTEAPTEVDEGVPDSPAPLYPPDEADVAAPTEADEPEVAEPEVVDDEVLTPLQRFTRRLGRSRASVGASLVGVFRRGIDEAAFEEVEELLIGADVGVDAALELVEGLRERCRDEKVTTADEAVALLKEIMVMELSVADRSMARRDGGPTVWMFTGVNGTGKTTSIGKLAKRHADEGQTVVLAAADTFRAAASEQLATWGERAGARVVRHGEGADPAAVAFDGWKAAESAGADLCMIDTAGRLQNKSSLMAELTKVKRVLEREAGPCDEVLLVLDATTGQNGLSQAKAFAEAVDVSGVILTKLDGTSKGGIVVAIQRALGTPVKLVGLGEDIADLADFDPEAFVEALFAPGEHDIDVV